MSDNIMTNSLALLIAGGWLIEGDDYLDDDEFSPTYGKYVRSYHGGPNHPETQKAS